jgi:hypothetical protein
VTRCRPTSSRTTHHRLELPPGSSATSTQDLADVVEEVEAVGSGRGGGRRRCRGQVRACSCVEAAGSIGAEKGKVGELGELMQTVSTDLLVLLTVEAGAAQASGRRWRS